MFLTQTVILKETALLYRVPTTAVEGFVTDLAEVTILAVPAMSPNVIACHGNQDVDVYIRKNILQI